MWFGLIRLGWALPLPWPDQLIAHGPLMSGGFLGTLIALERAVAFARPWAFAGPLLTASAALALVVWIHSAAAVLMTLGSAVLAAVSLTFWRRWRSLALGTMALGAVVWVIGNVWWLARGGVAGPTWWWLAFLVLTIAGERLELSRLLTPSRTMRHAFRFLVGLLTTAVALTVGWMAIGVRLLGVALLGTAVWLLRYDPARRNLGRPGQPRFLASCLIAGYLWLGLGGLLAAASAPTLPGPVRDAVLHAVVVGFALSMVFGHAPVVFPVLVGRPLPYHPGAYVPLVLLHGSLVLRLVGDLWPDLGRWRAWGGLGNALALVTFLAGTAWAVRRGAATHR